MNNGQSPAESDSNLHFLDYWRIVRIRKWVILSVFLLVVTTTTIFTLMWPKTYSSFVRVEVKKEAQYTTSLFQGGSSQFSQHDIYFMQTQFELIQSKDILYQVIEELNLNVEWGRRYGNPVPFETLQTFEILENKMRVEQLRNTDLIEITAYSEDPQEAADIANKIAEVYREHRIKDRQEDLEAGLVTLRQDRDLAQKEVDDLQQKINDEIERLGVSPTVIGVTSQLMDTQLEVLRQLEAQRVLSENEYLEANETVVRLEAMEPKQLELSLLTVQFDQPLSLLRSERATLEIELVSKQSEFGESNPEVIRAKQALQELNLQIEASVSGIMDGLRTKRDLKKKQLDELTRKADEARDKNKKLATDSLVYRKLDEELNKKKDQLRILEVKILQTDTDNKLLSQKVVRVTDPAEVAKNPVEPKIPRNIALGIVVGLIAGFGLAFFIEYLDTSVKTIDEVEAAVGAPVLSVIPQNVGSLIDEGPDSPHAEAYRVLRTNIIFQRNDEKANTLTVVSGGAGEGKSTTVFNLAVIFAQNDARILLIDSDLRRPSVHKILGISNRVGLTNVLLGKTKLEDAIQTTPQKGLDVLPSGKLPASAMGILNSPQLKELVEDVRSRYDFVFFDAPPIMGVSDSSILASMMDMTLLVIQYRKYPQAMTVRARQMVEKVGGNLVGVVMNNISISQDAYYYYYGGYHYSHYSLDEEQAVEDENEDKGRGSGNSGKDSTRNEPPKTGLNRKY